MPGLRASDHRIAQRTVSQVMNGYWPNGRPAAVRCQMCSIRFVPTARIPGTATRMPRALMCPSCYASRLRGDNAICVMCGDPFTRERNGVSHCRDCQAVADRLDTKAAPRDKEPVRRLPPKRKPAAKKKAPKPVPKRPTAWDKINDPILAD
jgi:hypothetical protein